VIALSPGVKVGCRLKTTSMLTCGSHASAKVEEDTDSGGGVDWAVGRFPSLGQNLPRGPFPFSIFKF
jgi:hypothetical protein